jgi:hypothetical protein
MSGIQIILIAGVLLIVLSFVSKFRKTIIDFALLLLLSLVALVIILDPGLTTKIAQLLGVGRGADLLLYLSVLIFWFLVIKLYARIRTLEKGMTEILRQQAIHNAVVNDADRNKE